MTTPELPPLPKVQPVLMDDMELGIIPDEFRHCRSASEARERILLDRIAELHKDLADCFRLTGADPDGNEDWRLAPDAVKEVAAMRTDLDLAEARVEELEAVLARFHERWLMDGELGFCVSCCAEYGEDHKPECWAIKANAARGAK